MDSLETLLDTVRRHGWARATLTPEQAEKQAYALRWTPIAMRRGEPTTVTLKPVPARQARRRSLSASYGTGAQPLHTDGAHMLRPPDVVVLFSAQTSATDTLLWRRPSGGLEVLDVPAAEMSAGMFLVDNGPDSFYASAHDAGRLRYDPGCMSACDARARAVAQYFERQRESATRHQWDNPGLALVLDNQKVLHARDSVAAGDEERELTRMAFTLEQVTS